jgi:hypothetical protein
LKSPSHRHSPNAKLQYCTYGRTPSKIYRQYIRTRLDLRQLDLGRPCASRRCALEFVSCFPLDLFCTLTTVPFLSITTSCTFCCISCFSPPAFFYGLYATTVTIEIPSFDDHQASEKQSIIESFTREGTMGRRSVFVSSKAKEQRFKSLILSFFSCSMRFFLPTEESATRALAFYSVFMIPTKCKFDALLLHRYFAVPTLSYVNHDFLMSTAFHLQFHLIMIVTFVLEFGMQDQSVHFVNPS